MASTDSGLTEVIGQLIGASGNAAARLQAQYRVPKSVMAAARAGNGYGGHESNPADSVRPERHQ